MRIAVDAMGGDHAPREIVSGVLASLQAFSRNDGDDGPEVVLVGIEDDIKRELDRADHVGNGVLIEPASQVIAMDESPVHAIKKKRDSSIARMVELARAGEVDACISAGNTGAFAASCQLRLKTLPGVARPGIAVVIPSFHGPIVLCDVGANLAPKAHHLHDYAVMASCYARLVLGIESPRVGMLSVGQEQSKGTALVRDAGARLARHDVVNFVGNVEGKDLFSGQADVIITDGFSGNLVLKITEGFAEGVFKTISDELAAESPEWADRFEPVIRTIWARHDYTEYGGAPLLGVGGTCIICHGRSDARAISNAVRVAADIISRGVNEHIVAAISRAKERR